MQELRMIIWQVAVLYQLRHPKIVVMLGAGYLAEVLPTSHSFGAVSMLSQSDLSMPWQSNTAVHSHMLVALLLHCCSAWLAGRIRSQCWP